jgi:hypothetical protein
MAATTTHQDDFFDRWISAPEGIKAPAPGDDVAGQLDDEEDEDFDDEDEDDEVDETDEE